MRVKAVGLLLVVLLTATGLHGQDNNGATLHVVQRGENLFRISLQYGLTVDQIARANGIARPDSIFVGQRLLIPIGDVTPLALQEIIHVVQPGETLDTIARLYALAPSVLSARNGVTDASALYVGQLLTIPTDDSMTMPTAASAIAPTPTVDPASLPTVISDTVPVLVTGEDVQDPTQTVIHIVARGESLFQIANDYGIEVMAIVGANTFTDPSVIYPGQELVIPGIEPTQYAEALPAPIERLTIAPLILMEGRTARIDFVTTAAVTVTGRFLDRELRPASQNEGRLHTLFVGVPLGTPSTQVVLTLQLSGGESLDFPINLQINAGGYRNEYLTLAADRLDLINANVDAAELELLRGVMTGFTPERLFFGLMGLPAAAPLSSPFGSIRSYNNGAFENVHTGTDFAAPAGAAILAPAAGRVVLADTLNVRGVATVLDHGWGIYTGYWHQTERYVDLGETVSAGQMIGTVGSTGRVTGAHLHWELWVNGVPVDPMQWVSEPLGM
ncbi:MAG: LysM peptidoglycan-binding domain-containing protein [Chloroflexota bacterium]|nr:LysM peptidoglycan-binding domain-containing protein [Chloroflexota bacterium]